MQNNKCFYINTYSYKQHHEIFNTVLLQSLADIYKEVNVCATQSSWNFISKKLNRDNVKFQKVKGVDKNTSVSYLLRYFKSGWENIKLLIEVPENVDIVFAFENVVSFWVINFLNKFLRKRLYIFCHGELELLCNDNKGITTNILRHYTKKSFLHKKLNGIKLLLLGDNIKNKFIEITNIDEKNIFSVDLPFISDDLVSVIQGKENLENKIQLGMIGSINPERGSVLYNKIIEENNNNNIEFNIVGNLKSENNIFNERKVKILGKNEFLPREEFSKHVSELDYILMLYSNNYYHLTASAVFFDAIIYKKPIIALKNDYFQYLFKKYGEVGYLFDNLKQIQTFINGLTPSTLELKTFNYLSYYENLQEEGFKKKLKQILETD